MRPFLSNGNSLNLVFKLCRAMLGKNKKEGNKKNNQVTARSRFDDYDKDPFFVKKDEESIKFLKKHGFPEEIVNRHRNRNKKK